ncbi:MFS transporter [Nocardioidaceae bacterium]|nr:MFS transporter [Nocardioidaceae bacterium]
MSRRAATASVLALLMATGWAANHVSALFPLYVETRGLSTMAIDSAFGVYALGLLPGLLAGGSVSDRIGRPRIVLPGACLAVLGTVVLALDAGALSLVAGRFVVGLGAGLTFAAGTAWATDLAARTGAVLAGVFLSAGFAVGPLVSGALGRWAPGPLLVPFVLSVVLSVAAILAATRWAIPSSERPDRTGAPPLTGPHQSVGLAASWALPVGALVFASVSVPLITVPTRLEGDVGGPLLVGVGSILSLGFGSAIQQVARVRGWGPRTGVVGAAASLLGFLLLAAAGEGVGLPIFVLTCLLLGTAYGLCLREGLLDVQALCPPGRRGALTGVFYVTTYLGFALPLLLTVLEPALGVRVPLLVVAAAAATVGLSRASRLSRGHPAR